MPSSLINSNGSNNLGWRFFFGLLMVLQAIALGVMWRTYDAISETSLNSKINSYQIEQNIIPAIKDNKREIAEIKSKL